jgi:2-polyprenyl-3-methyl-5-hydroxy-6-metoxy-1,4-benzoquinol methylase
MLQVNNRQKDYYESHGKSLAAHEKGNFFTRTWGKGRQKMANYLSDTGMFSHIYEELHPKWLGNLEGRHVLDLGCYKGNILSLPMARQAASYTGLDLSERAVTVLREALEAEGLYHAKAIAADFLSPEFQSEYKEKFDVIYAHSVVHHFEYLEVFLEKMHHCLKPGGVVVSLDPLQTFLPMKVMRTLYRPFQSDADWEFPFKESTLETISQHFDITDTFGIMGKMKWGLPLYFLSEPAGVRYGKKMLQKDMKETAGSSHALWSCMQVTMRWQKR